MYTKKGDIKTQGADGHKPRIMANTFLMHTMKFFKEQTKI
jgi:hypothetical protein